jgi:hypothetical protein
MSFLFRTLSTEVATQPPKQNPLLVLGETP